MDRGWKRFGALAVAVGAIIVAFAVLQPSEEELSEGGGRQPTTGQEPSDGEPLGGSRPILGGTRNEPGAEAGSEPIALAFAGGEVVGGAKSIEARSGEEVTLTVTSDVSEELHVHGTDLSEELPAGEEVEVAFTPQAQGIFEIELHDSGTLLAELEVR